MQSKPIQKEESTTKPRTNSTSDSQGKTSHKKKCTVSAETFGLSLISKESVGWPDEKEIDTEELVKGLRKKKYKLTYTDKDITEEDLIRWIEGKMLYIPETCLTIAEDSIFGKIREGLQEERSPPPDRQKQRQRKDTH